MLIRDIQHGPNPDIFGAPAAETSKKPHAKELSITLTKIDLIFTTAVSYGRDPIIPRMKLETWTSVKDRSSKQDRFMAFHMNYKTISSKDLIWATSEFKHHDFKHSDTHSPLHRFLNFNLSSLINQTLWVKEQSTPRWKLVSSSILHKKHLSGPSLPLLTSTSHVKAISNNINQQKILVFSGHLSFHRNLHHQEYSTSLSNINCA